MFKAERPAGGNFDGSADISFFVEQMHQMSMIVSNVIMTNEADALEAESRAFYPAVPTSREPSIVLLLATITVLAPASAIGFLAGELLRQA